MTGLSRHLARICLGIGAAMLLNLSASAASVLQVAAAADLANCISELNAAFSKTAGGAEVKASIGSSGNFFAQIKNGAPFDVFLSADMQYPGELAKSGQADAASLIVYARGQLMMWSSDPGLDPAIGLRLLSDPRVQRIAIANPDVAPYGRAAKAALEKAGLWQSLKPKLVFGENVAQTAQFVETGNAQVGFVGAAHIRNTTAKARAWPVPAELIPLIEQGAIVTAKGKGNPLAPKYLDFLRAEGGRAILRQYGFVLPEARP
jgi:molybdate transport system substrate-binding protein